MSDLIQSWIDQKSAQGGGVVFIPAGRYLVTSSIILKSNIQLQGEGKDKTILEMVPKKTDGSSASYMMIKADRISNIEISGMTIDGKKQQRSDLINNPYAHTISIAHTKNFLVKDLNIINSAGASIILFNSSMGEILDNSITASGSNAILGMQDTNNIIVSNNIINGTDNQNGIFFMYQDGKSTSNINIEDNVISDVADYAIEVGHTTHRPEDEPHRFISVKNNVITNAYCTGIGFRTVSDGVIEGNKITGYGKINDYGCNGIFVEGRRTLEKNVQVKNNIIKQTNPKVLNQPHPYQQAMYITGMDTMEITGNIIHDSWNDSIYVLAAFGFENTPDFPDGRRKYINIKIEENEILNSEGYGVHFDNYPSSGNTIIDNKIFDSQTGAILVEGDQSRVTVLNNITEDGPEEPPSEDNIWENNSNISPLVGYQKQALPSPGVYQLTFNARSSNNGRLEVFSSDRRLLNKVYSLEPQSISISNTFSTFFNSEGDVVFHALQGEIFLSNIQLIQIEGEDSSEEPKTEFEIKVDNVANKLITLHQSDSNKGSTLVELMDALIDFIS